MELFKLHGNSRVDSALTFTSAPGGAATITYATEDQVFSAMETANAAVVQAAKAEVLANEALAGATDMERQASDALAAAKAAGDKSAMALAEAQFAKSQATAAAVAAAAAEARANTAAAQAALLETRVQQAYDKAVAAGDSSATAAAAASLAQASAVTAASTAAAAEAKAAAADTKAAAALANAQQATELANQARDAATRAQEALSLATTAKTLASDALAGLTTLSVKRYGAVGDGITDDTRAIQAAIDAAAARGGATVSFPDGRYLVSSPITISGTVAIEGAGREGSVIKMAALTNLFMVNANNVRFKGLALDGPIVDQRVIQAADGISAISSANGYDGLAVSDCKISNFWNGIYIRGSNILISGVRFDKVGPIIDGVWQPGPACINNWANGVGDRNITVKDCIATASAGLTLFNGSSNVIVDSCSIDNASYIAVGNQRVSDFKLLNSTILNAFDNAVDCQQCSNSMIRGNTIVNAGRSPDPATGDRRAIFWGTDGGPGTEPSGLALIGNNIRNTGSGYAGGVNIASKGGANIVISSNNFEHVRNAIQKTASAVVSGNTFLNSRIDLFNSVSFTGNTLRASYMACDSLKDSLIEGNRFIGFWQDEAGVTKDHSLYLTGVSSGLTRLSIQDNQIVTGQPRAAGYYFIEAGPNLQTWSLSGNRTDARLLVKDSLNNIPTTFTDNSSEVISANTNVTMSAEMSNVIYAEDAAIGSNVVSLNLLGNAFLRKTRDLAVVLFGSSTAALGVWQVSSFDAGLGMRAFNVTRTSYTAGSFVDINVTQSGTSLNISAGGTNGRNCKLLVYFP